MHERRSWPIQTDQEGRFSLTITAALGNGMTVDPHETERTQNATSSPQQPLHVLLVEDGVANRKLASGLLKRWGHTVAVAGDGAAAVQMYRSNDFDLVLMDLRMPVMDGIEATKQIRGIETATGNHVPIIAMTADALEDDRQRCIQAGMDHHLSKPIRRKNLALAIELFFDPVEVGLDAASSANSGILSAGNAPPTMTINLDEALAMMEDDRRILCAVVKAFIEETPILLQRLTDAMEAGDQGVSLRAAHTLKGNLRILRQHDLQERWGRVEALASEGRMDEMREPAEHAHQMTLRALQGLTKYLEDED